MPGAASRTVPAVRPGYAESPLRGTSPRRTPSCSSSINSIHLVVHQLDVVEQRAPAPGHIGAEQDPASRAGVQTQLKLIAETGRQADLVDVGARPRPRTTPPWLGGLRQAVSAAAPDDVLTVGCAHHLQHISERTHPDAVSGDRDAGRVLRRPGAALPHQALAALSGSRLVDAAVAGEHRAVQPDRGVWA